VKKERVAMKKKDYNTIYLAAQYAPNGVYYELAGIVGYQKLSSVHYRFKTDFVFEQFRGKKIYSDLWDSRMNVILSYGAKKISAYCTDMSLPKYLKEGFKIRSISKNGIKYVTKII
jgi:hypothetical protein